MDAAREVERSDEMTWEEARQLHQDVSDLVKKMAESKRGLLQKYLQLGNELGGDCDSAKRLTMIVCRPCCPRSQRPRQAR